MSLDWDVSNVKDYENVCKQIAEDDPPSNVHGDYQKGDLIWRPETKALPFYCLVLGIPKITEANWQLFYARMKAYDGVAGPLLRDRNNNNPIDMAEVHKHIGLRTNATSKTPKSFETDVLVNEVKDQWAVLQRRNNSKK